MIEVWHAKKPNFGLGDPPAFPDEYVQVATVQTDNVNLVFQLTNSIEDVWWHNEGVTLCEGIDRARSTSVGDVAVKDNSVYRCASIGWDFVGPVFRRLEVKNSWEYLTFSLNGTALDEKKGGTCTVKWPDGTIDDSVAFFAYQKPHTYPDHGNESHGQHYELLIPCAFKGVPMLVELWVVEIANVVQMEGFSPQTVCILDHNWDALHRDERVWRLQAWGWNHYIKPDRLAQIRLCGDKGYRLLEATDLVAPWTPTLMLESHELVSLSEFWPNDFWAGETGAKRARVAELRARFLAAGIDTMECFFDPSFDPQDA